MVKANPSLEPKLQLASIEQTLPAALPTEPGRPFGWQDPAAWAAFGSWMFAHKLLQHDSQCRAAAIHQRVPARAGNLARRQRRAGRESWRIGGDGADRAAHRRRRLSRSERRHPRGGPPRGWRDGGHSFVGFHNGWAGVLDDEATELTLESTAGILPRGGTILGTSRTNPFAEGQDGTAADPTYAERPAAWTP